MKYTSFPQEEKSKNDLPLKTHSQKQKKRLLERNSNTKRKRKCPRQIFLHTIAVSVRHL